MHACMQAGRDSESPTTGHFELGQGEEVDCVVILKRTRRQFTRYCKALTVEKFVTDVNAGLEMVELRPRDDDLEEAIAQSMQESSLASLPPAGAKYCNACGAKRLANSPVFCTSCGVRHDRQVESGRG